jgi:hypothetical protein
MRRLVVWTVISLIVLPLIIGCTPLRRAIIPYEGEPLVWQPTESIQDLDLSKSAPIYKHKIKVLPFADNRAYKKGIADKVTTKDDVAAWSTDRFTYILKQIGLNIVDSGETIVIRGEILTFAVVEDSLYRGNIGIKLNVESTDGKSLWQGMLVGQHNRWGGTYKLENYYEALCNAYLDAMKRLLINDAFVSVF